MCNPCTCDYECNEACKIDEYVDIKKCSYEKHLFSKLDHINEDEILKKD